MQVVDNAFVPLTGLSTSYICTYTTQTHTQTQAMFIHKFNCFQSYNNNAADSHGENEFWKKLKK